MYLAATATTWCFVGSKLLTMAFTKSPEIKPAPAIPHLTTPSLSDISIKCKNLSYSISTKREESNYSIVFIIIIYGYVLYYTTKANSKQTVLKPVAMQFKQTCDWSNKCVCLTGKSQICETEGKENSVHDIRITTFLWERYLYRYYVI